MPIHSHAQIGAPWETGISWLHANQILIPVDWRRSPLPRHLSRWLSLWNGVWSSWEVFSHTWHTRGRGRREQWGARVSTKANCAYVWWEFTCSLLQRMNIDENKCQYLELAMCLLAKKLVFVMKCNANCCREWVKDTFHLQPLKAWLLKARDVSGLFRIVRDNCFNDSEHAVKIGMELK